MNIIADTCIWSLALRRNNAPPLVINTLKKLITEFRIQMIGPIRQELLSGIPSPDQFVKLKTYLAAFPDLAIHSNDYEQAAEYFNACRSCGIQGSHIDFLICSVAVRNNLQIYTIDKDFELFSKAIPIKLYYPRK